MKLKIAHNDGWADIRRCRPSSDHITMTRKMICGELGLFLLVAAAAAASILLLPETSQGFSLPALLQQHRHRPNLPAVEVSHVDSISRTIPCASRLYAKKKKKPKKSGGKAAVAVAGGGGTKGFGSAVVLSSSDSGVELDKSNESRDFYRWLEEGGAGDNLKRTALAYFGEDDGFNLRGVAALRDTIRKGDDIINIPYELAVNLGQQGEDPTVPAVELLRDYCACMANDAEHRENSNTRASYYRMLPSFQSLDCLGSTDFFSQQALDELQQPLVVEETLRRRNRVQERFDSTIEGDDAFPPWIDGTPVTVEHLRWAVWLVTSRVLTVQGDASKGESYRLLIPYLDMCNHDRNSPHVLTGRAVPGGRLKIVAGANVKKVGEQITICYGGGVAGNDRFVQDYGFLDVDEEGYRIVAQQLLGKIRVREGSNAGTTISKADSDRTIKVLQRTTKKEDEAALQELPQQGNGYDPALRIAIEYRLGLKRALSKFITMP